MSGDTCSSNGKTFEKNDRLLYLILLQAVIFYKIFTKSQ